MRSALAATEKDSLKAPDRAQVMPCERSLTRRGARRRRRVEPGCAHPVRSSSRCSEALKASNCASVVLFPTRHGEEEARMKLKRLMALVMSIALALRFLSFRPRRCPGGPSLLSRPFKPLD